MGKSGQYYLALPTHCERADLMLFFEDTKMRSADTDNSFPNAGKRSHHFTSRPSYTPGYTNPSTPRVEWTIPWVGPTKTRPAKKPRQRTTKPPPQLPRHSRERTLGCSGFLAITFLGILITACIEELMVELRYLEAAIKRRNGETL